MFRPLALALATLLSVAAFGGQQSAKAPAKWAIVIGVDEYETGNIPRLQGAVADARGIAAALTKYVGIPEDHLSLFVTGGPNLPKREDIYDKLNDIKQAAEPDDLFVFFFAGHAFERDGQQFLLTYESRRDTIGSLMGTSLPSTVLRNALQTMKVRNQIVMIDACRDDPTAPTRMVSEAFEREFVFRGGDERGLRATFLSATHGESAYESPSLQRGYFSYYIEQGLSGGAVSLSADGVTVGSLFNDVTWRVRKRVKEEIGKVQTPWPEISGDLILVPRERLPVTPPPTPPGPGAPSASPRTVYGFVTNAAGNPLQNATVSLVASDASGRSITLTGAAPGVAKPLATVTTNAVGFYTVEGLPGDASLMVRAELSGYLDQIVITPPAEAGKMTPIVLARAGLPMTSRGLGGLGGLSSGIRGSTPATGQDTEFALVAYRSFLAEDFDQARRAALQALIFDDKQPLAKAVIGNIAAFEATKDRAKLSEAQRLTEEALKLAPNLALAHNARGLAYFVAGEVADARREFEAAVRLDRTLAVAHANLAETLRAQKRFGDAERSFKEAIRLRPDTAIPYNGLATVLFNQEKYGDAVKQARQAIARYDFRDKMLGEFYANLAIALLYQGNLNQAVESMAQATSLGHTADERDKRIDEAVQKAKGKSPESD